MQFLYEELASRGDIPSRGSCMRKVWRGEVKKVFLSSNRNSVWLARLVRVKWVDVRVIKEIEKDVNNQGSWEGKQAVEASTTLAGLHWPSLWILAVGPAPTSALLLVPGKSVIGCSHSGAHPGPGGRDTLGCQLYVPRQGVL